MRDDAVNFPFHDEPNTATIICSHIIEEHEPILYVSHDEDDGMWQFLCGKQHRESEARIVSLYSAFMQDPTVAELSEMPCGYFAERENIDSQWVIRKKFL